jgi:hypothetical protein
VYAKQKKNVEREYGALNIIWEITEHGALDIIWEIREHSALNMIWEIKIPWCIAYNGAHVILFST